MSRRWNSVSGPCHSEPSSVGTSSAASSSAAESDGLSCFRTVSASRRLDVTSFWRSASHFTP